MTESRFRRIERHPHDIGPQEYAEVRRLAGLYQFLHWHHDFPAYSGTPPDERQLYFPPGDTQISLLDLSRTSVNDN